MIYRRTYLLILLLFLIKNTVIAQTAKFSWVGDMCSSVGTYKLSDYTESQIRDTYRIAMTQDFRLNTGSIPPFSLEELNRENGSKFHYQPFVLSHLLHELLHLKTSDH